MRDIRELLYSAIKWLKPPLISPDCRSRCRGVAEQPRRHAERRFEMPAEVGTAAIAPGVGDLGERAVGMFPVAQVFGTT